MAGPVERPPLPPTHQKTSLLKLLVVSGFAAHLLSRETANQSVLGVITARRRTRKKKTKTNLPPGNKRVYLWREDVLVVAVQSCTHMRTHAHISSGVQL